MKPYVKYMMAVGAGMAALAAAGQDIDPDSDPAVQPWATTTVNGYQLAWSDEFNGSAVDTNKWIFREGDDSRTYIKSFQTAANNSVSGGVYRCLLKKEPMGTKQYTAGGIISRKLMRYGYYEARLKVPPTGGWHTSFWMMNRNNPGSPHIELDVIENDSVDLYDYGVNVHRHRPTPHMAYGTKTVPTPSLNAAFHVFGCEFTPGEIRYYFDGALVQTVDATQFAHNDLNVWLTSLALVYDGQSPVDDSQLPVEAQYDYVRFFELGPYAAVSITSPDIGGTTLNNTNTTVALSAVATPVNTNAAPQVVWSKVSGPGTAVFEDAAAAHTGVRFSADGLYELACSAIIGNATNSDTVSVSVNAPVSVSFQHGVNGYDNPGTFIRGDLPGRNSGADNELIVGRWGGQPLRGLLSFDLGSLDPEAVIHSAELTLYNYGGSGTVGTMQLHELSAPFVEGTGDGNSDASGAGSGATWYSRTGTQNWAVAGGDFFPTLLSSMPGYNASIAGYKTFSSSAGLVASAQGALNSAQPLNLLVSSPATETGGANAISRLRSDDAPSVNERPLLTLTYLGNFLPDITAGPNLTGRTNSPVLLSGTAAHADSVLWESLGGPGTVLFSDATGTTNSARFSLPGRYQLRLNGYNTRGTGYQDISVSISDDRPPFNGISISNHVVALEINAVTGLTYTLQSSTNLLSNRWTDLITTNAAGDPLILESNMSGNPAAFYRLILEP